MIDRVRHTIRATALIPLAIGLVVSTAVVAIDVSATTLEAVSVLLAAGLAFSLDDPAHETLAASPTTFFARRMSRISVALVPVGIGWVAAWSVYLITGDPTVGEMGALVALALGLAGLSLGVAGLAGRREGRGGVFAGPIVLALLLVSAIFSERWRPLPLGDVPGGFPAIIERWAAAAVTGFATFLWSSRDVARRHASRRS